ncbi:MAG: hypothetical protein AB1806_18530 [Acidobacteriota bacterium]
MRDLDPCAGSADPTSEARTAQRLTHADLGDIIRFLRAHYGDRYYGAEERYVRWLYLDTPCEWYRPRAEDGWFPANGVKDTAGTLRALHAFVPFDARTPWGGTVGVWDIEWINALGMPGVGRRLARHLLADVDLYVGYGCNALAEAAFRRLGLTVVPEIPRRVAVLDRDVLETVLGRIPDAPESMSIPAPSRVPDVSWCVLDSVDDIPDVALEARDSATPLGTSRSRAWLRWRYDRHPAIQYRLIAADPHASSGVAIVRLERVTNMTATACRMVDFITPPGRESSLFGAALAYARDRQCFLLDYFSTDEAAAARLDIAAAELNAGILATPDLPYMFQPPAIGEGRSINLVIAEGGRAPGGCDLRMFHATKADANQDILREEATGPRPDHAHALHEDTCP